MKRAGLLMIVFSLVAGLLPIRGYAADLNVAGKSAVLMDVATGTILYEQNPHEALAPASVTKVMTMLLIMEAIDSGKIHWDDPVTASEAAAAKGGSQIYLKVGESMSVSDMVKSIAVSSANDCACAMAEHLAGSESAFVDMMNARAQELGMADTHFVNCTGLDDGAEAVNHRTSAHDIAIMSRELLKNHPDIKRFTTIWMDTVRNGAFGLSNTNKMVRFYDGCTGLKTGFTNGAGYCLSASAQRNGLELIAVVMGSATSADRFAACKGMLDYGFANFALYEPVVQEGASVPVTLGKSGAVGAVPKEDTQLLVEKGQANSIVTEVELADSAKAPIAVGDQLGIMTIKAGDRILKQIPLVAESHVDRLTWGDLTVLMLRRIAMAQPST